MGADTVDIYVGSEEHHFRVHKDILCKKVPYFDKMFNSGFSEAASSSATFPEDYADSFDVLLGWVYYGQLRELTILTKNSPQTEDGDGSVKTSWCPSEAHCLAEKLCLPHLQDTVMNASIAFYKSENCIPSRASMRFAYKRTSEKSPLRRLMVRYFTWVLAQEEENGHYQISGLRSLLQESDDMNKDFLALLRIEVFGSSGAPQKPTSMDICMFHCHGKDEPCATGKDI